MVKNYELMTIAKVSSGEQKASEISKKIQELIPSLGGEVIKNDFWGKRKFAFTIEHDVEGFYDVITFKLDSLKLKEVKGKLNLMTDLVRYLVTAIKAA